MTQGLPRKDPLFPTSPHPHRHKEGASSFTQTISKLLEERGNEPTVYKLEGLSFTWDLEVGGHDRDPKKGVRGSARDGDTFLLSCVAPSDTHGTPPV